MAEQQGGEREIGEGMDRVAQEDEAAMGCLR